MTATTERRITVTAFQKSFDFFTEGFWALCRVDDAFRQLFNGASIPTSPQKGATNWLDIELAAQRQAFGTLLMMPYYCDPDSPHNPGRPIVELNSVEYNIRSGMLHFKIERTENGWTFIAFPPDGGFDGLVDFRQRFESAGWDVALAQ